LILLVIGLANVSALRLYVQPVKAVYNVIDITINADGSITPADAPITNVNNTFYTLTDDVNITGVRGPYNGVAVRIMRGDIMFNGNGHTITNGAGYDCFGIGYGINNVTIANSTAIGFNICLYINSDNCTIKGNTFSGSGYIDNVRLDAANNNYFEGNNITNSGGSCVWMYHYPGLNNTFVRNYIVNSNGIAIGRNLGGGGATFYHNVIGGGIQAYYTPACIWDNGYPSGGNYWIGYVSPDKFSGLYQNITGSDGIGDTPYVIDADDIDHYPFMMIDICNVSQTPSRDSVTWTDVVEVNATVTHYFPLDQVVLNCTYTNSTATWTSIINMTNLEDDIWNGIIPESPVGTNVTYVIIAQDNAGTSINSTSQGYIFDYPVVIPEFPTIALLPILFVATLSAALLSRRRHALG
jgi:predicted secreted protein with PEFG-CTERM motif